MKNWKINSWKKYPVKHIPEYPDKKELDQVLDKIRTFPPLVFAGETRHLKQQLSDVVDGKAFLLQGGDCAESFAEFHPDNIRDTFKLMLQMSLVLTYSAPSSRLRRTRHKSMCKHAHTHTHAHTNHTHAHTNAHAHTCAYTHVRVCRFSTIFEVSPPLNGMHAAACVHTEQGIGQGGEARRGKAHR